MFLELTALDDSDSIHVMNQKDSEFYSSDNFPVLINTQKIVAILPLNQNTRIFIDDSNGFGGWIDVKESYKEVSELI